MTLLRVLLLAIFAWLLRSLARRPALRLPVSSAGSTALPPLPHHLVKDERTSLTIARAAQRSDTIVVRADRGRRWREIAAAVLGAVDANTRSVALAVRDATGRERFVNLSLAPRLTGQLLFDSDLPPVPEAVLVHVSGSAAAQLEYEGRPITAPELGARLSQLLTTNGSAFFPAGEAPVARDFAIQLAVARGTSYQSVIDGISSIVQQDLNPVFLLDSLV